MAKLNQLKERLAELERQKIETTTKLNLAKEKLEENFGVKTKKEAQKLIDKLEKEVEQESKEADELQAEFLEEYGDIIND